MRMILTGFGLTLGLAIGAADVAAAQPYCALLQDGTRSCGIPTYQSCEQTLSGIGGSCVPDESAQLRPNLIDRLRSQRFGFDPAPPPPPDNPLNPDWMPPPPNQ